MFVFCVQEPLRCWCALGRHFNTTSCKRRFAEDAGADPGFSSGGPSRVLTTRGGLSPNFAQNRGFTFKIFSKLHDFDQILGAGGPEPPGPLDPLLGRGPKVLSLPSPGLGPLSESLAVGVSACSKLSLPVKNYKLIKLVA